MRGLALALAGSVLVAPAPVAAADEVPDDEVCGQARPDRDYDPRPRDVADESSVAAPLRLAEAHRIATGDGVGVAVIDTGIDPGVGASGRLRLRDGSAVPGMKKALFDIHGTLVAGLVAGHLDERDLGVAPDAHVVPIRVADGGQAVVESYGDDEGLRGVTAANIAAGIRLALQRADRDQIKVINISLSVRTQDDALDRAVREAERAGILVVAAAGNRPQAESGDSDDNAFEPGEDRLPWPARTDSVLAVTALAPDLSLDPAAVETGPGVDVSAPVVGAATLGPEATVCRVADLATSWATAEVSGLAALLFETFPDITPEEVRTRIIATARGSAGASLEGAGMVQPVAALTAELAVDDDGRLATMETQVDPPPPLDTPRVAPDELADARSSLRWWALGAGGALVLALLLRPLVARRH